jgi:hypothetical protein
MKYLQIFTIGAGQWWCRTFHGHKQITQPVRGIYRCLRCLREYPTKF